MPVNYNFKKGIDIPVWLWEPMFPPAIGYHGASTAYDGKRHLYVIEQYGSTATTASTTALYRFDTWSGAWQFLGAATSGNQGMDIEYDSIRNVLYILTGASTTTWQVFNLNNVSVTIANVACAAFAFTTMTPVLPAAAPLGSSFTMPSDDAVPAQIDTGTADAGGTTTSVVATAATGTFGLGMIGLQVRFTSGTYNGQIRTISGVTAPTTLSFTPALAGAPAAGDTFVIELVADTATGGSTTTVVDSTANWTTNMYANMDVIITGGTGSGQRRRIASNTATTLTLAGATTGNARTGAFTTAPVAGSTFRIVPSADFLYYQVGGGTGLYRIDVAQTTGAAWSAALAAVPAATGGGANTFYPAAYAPYQILAFRGAGTAQYYMYNIGTNAWTTPTVFAAGETFTTGASAAMVSGKRKLIILKEATTRLYVLDLLTGIYEPGGYLPYAAPGGYDGKRLRVVTSPDGAQFLYVRRAAGPEFYRLALEWLQ